MGCSFIESLQSRGGHCSCKEHRTMEESVSSLNSSCVWVENKVGHCRYQLLPEKNKITWSGSGQTYRMPKGKTEIKLIFGTNSNNINLKLGDGPGRDLGKMDAIRFTVDMGATITKNRT